MRRHDADTGISVGGNLALVADASGYGSGVFEQCFNFGDHHHFELGGSVKKDEISEQSGGRFSMFWDDLYFRPLD